MNKAVFCALACAIVGFSSSVLAQSLPERCQQEEKKIASQQASIEEIDKEIAELRAKLDELNQQKQETAKSLVGKKGEKSRLAAEIKADTRKKNKMCAPLVTCANYEKELDGLMGENREMAKELKSIRQAAQEQVKAAVKLRKKMKKMEAEYTELGCDKLVLGEDEQKTVDRCQKLFADWTARQTELKKVKAAIAELRNSYRKQNRELKKAARAYLALQKKMRKSCSFSARLTEVDAAVKEHEGLAGIDKEIKEADQEATIASRVKIIQPKIIEKKKRAKREPGAKLQGKKPAKDRGKGKTDKRGKWGLKLKVDAKGGADTGQGTAGGKIKPEAEVTDPQGKKKKKRGIDFNKKIKQR